jgi:integrase
LRRAEVAQVHTSDVVEGHGGAQLVVRGKGGKTRGLPISDSLAVAVRASAANHTPRQTRDRLAILGRPRRRAPHGPLRRQDRRRRAAGRLVDAQLRYRFATRAYRGTRNLRAVQTLLGHASAATTERYTAVDDDEVRAAIMAASDS